MPHKRSVTDGSEHIDEERRLCYVGVTRARETLTLTLCKARMKWGKLRPQIPSRFLMEMRGDAERALHAAEASEKRFREEAEAAERAEQEKKKPRKKRAAARKAG